MDEAIRIHTQKNGVDIRGNEVKKKFHLVPKGLRRLDLEARALQRMVGATGIPLLLEHSRKEERMVMSRLPGVDLTHWLQSPDSTFVSLRIVVTEMLERGVASRATPPRNVIVQLHGTAGLVDLERVTLRWSQWTLIWWFACGITNFRFLRLLAKYAPHPMTFSEHRRLAWQWRLRGGEKAVPAPGVNQPPSSRV